MIRPLLSRAPGARPLLLAGTLSCAGCLAGERGEAGGTTGAQTEPTGPAGKAYFLLHWEDLFSAGWPEDFRDYDLLVADPSLPARHVARIRAELPGARLLAYASAQDVPIGEYGGNPYYDRLTAAFDSTLCIRDLATGNVVRIFGRDPEVPGSGRAAFVMSPRSAEVLLAFHRDVTLPAGWDGLYIDQCTAAWPPWRKRALEAISAAWDIDGDGRADDLAALEAQYAVGRPYFTERLREVLGAGVLLVGNSGGPLDDPALNGIALENPGDRFEPEEARSYLLAQALVAHPPGASIVWSITEASRAASAALAAELPEVYFGVTRRGSAAQLPVSP